jgi:predicted metal-dependent phosphoesterase TrpH
LEKGYIKHFGEAFEKYIGRGGIGYIERPKISSAQACDLITSAGGVPVLAHPKYLETPETVVEDLIPHGLSGIEIYYGDQSAQEIDEFLEISRRYDLLPCGGSDYHATGSVGEKLPGEIGPPIWVAQELLKRSRQIKQVIRK